jgi:hypothetical protein
VLSIPFIIIAFQINLVIAGWRKFTHDDLPRLWLYFCKLLHRLWYGKILVKVGLIRLPLDYAWRRRRRDAESDTSYFYGGDRLSEVTGASSSSSLHRRVPDEDNSWDQPAVSRFIRVPPRARGRRQRTVALPEEYA